MSDRTYVKIIDIKDEYYGKIGYIGRWDHNCGDVHFDDGSSKNYDAYDLELIDNE